MRYWTGNATKVTWAYGARFAVLRALRGVCGAVGPGSRAALRSPLGCPPRPLPCGGCALARVRGARGRGWRVVAALLRCLCGGASALVLLPRAEVESPPPAPVGRCPLPGFRGGGDAPASVRR